MKVKPYGILKTCNGNEYFLLRPHPLASDSWMQRMDADLWYVAEMIVDYDNDMNRTHYTTGRSFHLLTTHPDIEFRWDMKEIEIGNIQEVQEDVSFEVPEPPEVFSPYSPDEEFERIFNQEDVPF